MFIERAIAFGQWLFCVMACHPAAARCSISKKRLSGKYTGGAFLI
ncbi:hypothetical protein RUMCAL_01489 [Ruminococcus callidus ATCC 27760]|uniref:Uncharacterized protein n=1 Tax=Ruminococcus callidus ATCC 27760 TaxID=411473 RepID=U2KVQ8_9FIRM|nr:hypothetical protein RUMCAL_01489 [Ruminococcus callidus ATCC 27760]